MQQTIKEILLPQRFSTNGIRLDALSGYQNLAEFFRSAGLGGKNFVYATDVITLRNSFADGNLSVESCRKMGLGGTDAEISQAIDILQSILQQELPAQEEYPIKISITEQLNYNRNGVLLSRTIIEPNGEFLEVVYDNGNPERILKKYMKKADGTMHFVEYNPVDPTKIQAEAITSPAGIKTKRVYSYDNKNNLKSLYESGNNHNKITLVDETGRVLYIQDTMGNLTKKNVNIYDDAACTVLNKLEGDPKLLAQGILRKETVFSTVDGQKTEQILSEVNIMMD